VLNRLIVHGARPCFASACCMAWQGRAGQGRAWHGRGGEGVAACPVWLAGWASFSIVFGVLRPPSPATRPDLTSMMRSRSSLIRKRAASSIPRHPMWTELWRAEVEGFGEPEFREPCGDHMPVRLWKYHHHDSCCLPAQPTFPFVTYLLPSNSWA
jgi:hypothetical protein